MPTLHLQAEFCFEESGEVERLSNKRIEQLIYVKSICNEDGDRFCLIEVIDVTDAVRREQALIQLSEQTRCTANQLREEEEKTRAILNGAKDCIVTLDAKGFIETANVHTEKVFKLNNDNSTGENITQFILPMDDQDQLISENTEAFLSMASLFDDVVELKGRREHEVFKIDLSINQILTDGSKGYVAIIRDITSQSMTHSRGLPIARYSMSGWSTQFTKISDPLY